MQITNVLELEGKTIERTVFVDCGEKLVIVFIGGDYVVFHATCRYDEIYFLLSPSKLSVHDSFDAGLITKEEFNSVLEKEQQRLSHRKEVWERRNLALLKKKYEGDSQ